MEDDRTRLFLPRRYLLIVLLPLAVYLCSEWLLWLLGRTKLVVPPLLRWDAHAEAAARFRVIATFLLVISAAVACIAYFAFAYVRLDKISRRATRQAYAAVLACISALLIGLWIANSGLLLTEEMVGQEFVCQALSQDYRAAAPAELGSECLSPAGWSDYERMRLLINIESAFLYFAIPALAFGSIVCLGWPAGRIGPNQHRQVREELIGRLSTFLYISAFLLVSGLLFLSAFLHWPLFAVEPGHRNAYREHVHAVVLFHGVAYTVMLGSYYLPVAGLLARRWRGLELVDEKKPGGEMLDWQGFLKATLAVFAPLIVGLLGDVMKVPMAGG